MLTQQEADALLRELKEIVNPSAFSFPQQNKYGKLALVGKDSNADFIVDVNRRGTLRIEKCTFQERVFGNTPLLRLDIDGPEHQNPDGTILSRNHLHIYREGYEVRWAIDIPEEFVDPNDLITTLINFLEYCKASNYKDLILQGMVI